MTTFALDRGLWKPLRYHKVQVAFWLCAIQLLARFIVVAAGRRSGKTELALRILIFKALAYTDTDDGLFICAAPTREQAKKIFWKRLLRMIPREFVSRINRTELAITLITGTTIRVAGLDKPMRVEGEAIDGVVVDEYDETKPEAWSSSIRPALSTIGRRPGWAILIGRPKGRRNIWERFREARESTTPGEWAAFHWPSSEIIDPAENESAKRTLDPRSYDQEYNANFVNFEGRVYYTFEEALHAFERLPYFANEPIVFDFDFNVKPGVAGVQQEQLYGGTNPRVARNITATIGEVWIPTDSNTPRVVNKLIEQWGKHPSLVYVYGDATGGAGGTAKVDGTDWDIIERLLRKQFGDRLRMRVPDSNPLEKVRVNAVNARFLNADGVVSALVDPQRAPRHVDDFLSVTSIPGTSGEIDKKSYPMQTHISDGYGYYIAERFPTTHSTVKSFEY